MNERLTGVTDAQIDAALYRWRHAAPIEDDAVPTMRNLIELHARALVPPDHVVMGPEDIAALRGVLKDARDCPSYFFVSEELDILAERFVEETGRA
jgi:hypothetical protein